MMETNQQLLISQPKEQTDRKPALLKYEVVKFGPYRFIGKSMYARAGKSDDLCGALWNSSDWVFHVLDTMPEYATDEKDDTALVTWEKYDEKNKLMGYTVGRFMKENTPVPENMDYVDIPEMDVAKGWMLKQYENIAEQLVKEETERRGIYIAASWIYMAEVNPKLDVNGASIYGYFIPCQPKNPD